MAGMAGRRVGKLTARQVETVKKPGLYGDGGNLFLKVDDGGSKSWMFRHQVSGKVRKYGLGPTHTVSLSRRSATCRDDPQAVARRHRPEEARRAEQEAAAVAEAKSISFDKATEAYIDSHRAGWKSDKHAGQWRATLATYAIAGIRQVAGERHRHRHGDAGAGADLGQQERDGAPAAGPHRERAVVGQGPRLSQRREPGAVARPSRPSAAGTRQGPQGRASRRTALRSATGLHA